MVTRKPHSTATAKQSRVSDTVERGEEQLRERLAGELVWARERSAHLTALDDGELTTQHSPIMSPLVWDLAHVGNQEELWLIRDVGRQGAVRGDIDELYDAFKHPRKDRPQLPLLGPTEARGYAATVREKVLDVLEREPLTGRRLTDGGFVFGMVAQHEQQHVETMLATHQLRAGAPALDAPAPDPPQTKVDGTPREVFIPGGTYTMGTSVEPWALDNERPAHDVEVDAFWIDTFPVRNADYAAFIRAGGYHDPRWWTPAGWTHRQQVQLVAPMSWERDGDWWVRRRFGHVEPVPPDEPVQHVCWFEADAYARWVGRRLPTEAEWEKAARFDPETGRSRRYPWGDEEPTPELANLGGRHLQPAAIGSYPEGASPGGIRQLIGDVWEWTSSDFRGYPGFEAYPYAEYSEVFFGPSYKMLRGGSWATAPVACRGTFRNWDLPIRRQIFTGFRCARDAAAGER